MKLYEAVAQTLLDSGVERMFGVMGNGNEGFIATYLDALPGGYVAASHESAAVSMADGYSRRSGRVGIATVTHGPGVTNALTALGEAVRARSAVVLITSDPAPQREHRQWIDLRAAARLSGAAYRMVQTPESCVDDICLAMRMAQSLRQPVMLNIPKAVLDLQVDYQGSPFGLTAPLPQAIAPDADRLDAALGVIASANRPVILAGRGAVLAGARDALISLSQALQAPLATTVLALDYFDGCDLNLGIFGNEAHSLAVEYLSQADCVIVVGAGLNEHTTANGDLLRGKAVVQCDSDLRLLESRHPATVAVLADGRVFTEQVDEAIRGLGPRPASSWAGTLRERLKTFNEADDFVDGSGSDTVDMRTAMMALNRVLPAGRIQVTDNGRFKTAPWRHLRCSPGEFAHTGSFGSIGLALGHAIGSCFARPDRLVVAVAGDGGLMQGLVELTTAVEHRLRLVVAVLNDRSYGSEYKMLRNHGHNPDYSLRPWPSLAGIAESMGARGIVITKASQIEELEPVFADQDGPVLLDIRADPAVDPRRYK